MADLGRVIVTNPDQVHQNDRTLVNKPVKYEHRILSPVTTNTFVFGTGGSLIFDTYFDNNSDSDRSILNELALKYTVTNAHATLAAHLPYWGIFALLSRIIVRKAGNIVLDISDYNIIHNLITSYILEFQSYQRYRHWYAGSCQTLTDPSQTHTIAALSTKVFFTPLSMLLERLFVDVPCNVAGKINFEFQFFNSGTTFQNVSRVGLDSGLTLASLTLGNCQMIAMINHFSGSVPRFNTLTKRTRWQLVKSFTMSAPGTTKTYLVDLSNDFSPCRSLRRLWFWHTPGNIGDNYDTTNVCTVQNSSNIVALELLVNNKREWFMSYEELANWVNRSFAVDSQSEDQYNSAGSYRLTAVGAFIPFNLNFVDTSLSLHFNDRPISKIDNLATSDRVTVNITITTPNLTTAYASGTLYTVLSVDRIYELGENDKFEYYN